jgi:predicted Zn-dependent protease
VLSESDRCEEAIRRFDIAIAGGVPGADGYLGRAGCEVQAHETAAARRSLTRALGAEPGNPVVNANMGRLLSDTGQPAAGIPYLQSALAVDPDLHQARFALAVAFARGNHRTEAAAQAKELLRRLSTNAPQRSEVERLLRSVQ